MEKNDSLYNALVKDDDDIVGMITYAFYKRHKLEYFENNFKTENITENDIRNFKKGVTVNIKNGFQMSAIAKLKTWADAVVNEHRAELLESVIKETAIADKAQKEKIESLIKRQEAVLAEFESKVQSVLTNHIVETSGFSWKSFLVGIAGNIVASFVWLLIVLVILLSVEDSKKEQVIEKAQKVFLNKDVVDTTGRD